MNPFSPNTDPIGITLLARRIFVVLVKDGRGKLTLIAQPGEAKPFSTKNRGLAEMVARDCDGMAATWEDAFKLLLKENPNFEQELLARIQTNSSRIADNVQRIHDDPESTGTRVDARVDPKLLRPDPGASVNPDESSTLDGAPPADAGD